MQSLSCSPHLQLPFVALTRLVYPTGNAMCMHGQMHCDGFVNWPSNVTDYNIQNTPWGRKGRGTYSELVKAFRAEGLKVGACKRHSFLIC
eukprot:COSAG02_NODE_3003_length_7572_cov_5.390740_3_plen_90_part_00